jgi:hypothetical protein
MPAKLYCQFTSFCTDVNCRCLHHHDKTERQLLEDIIRTSDEHVALIDGFKPSYDKFPCKFGVRCFEKDCTFSHSGIEDLEMRKVIFKQFNKQFKAIQMKKKIEKEIKEVKNAKVDWADM